MHKAIVVAALVVAISVCSGCSSIPVTRVSVQSFELQKDGVEPAAGVSRLMGVLVDRGFDVKLSDPQSGIITTEYKKFANVATDPPFDYYMQIRSKVRAANGVTSIQMIPVVREQNRGNAAAFTEHELEYFTGERESLQDIQGMNAVTGWRTLGQVLFMNVVTDAAQALGLSADSIIRNVSESPANARDFEGD